MPIHWPRFVEVIRSHQRFLLISHVRPDADALGSELAMAGALEALGKHVRIVNGQATPPNLQFLDPDKKIKAINIDVQPPELADVEVAMILDTSAWVQLGAMADVFRALTAKKIVLDHHMSDDELGAEMFKDVTAEATGRLVVDAVHALGLQLTPQIATPAFAALATDTGWYRFASTSGNTYRCAGELVDAGANPAGIYKALYEHDTLARLRLIGRTLARAQTDLGGRLIYTSVKREDFTETGAIASDTEDVINMTLQVAGTEVAVICVELTGGKVKISLRSRGKMDCSRLAEQFSGGGHKAAAGATLDGPVEEAQRKVLDAVRAALR
jgi:phosphoesterase RecJ-like protein